MPTNAVFLVAGGTGGHVFPALALGQVLHQLGYHPLYLTDRRSRGFISDISFPVYTIHAASFNRNILSWPHSMMEIIRGCMEVHHLCQKYHPKLIIGFGGYASFPALLMAKKFHLPIILHEQNAVLGRTNAKLARFATWIATGYSEVKGVPTAILPKLRWTGTPVRTAFEEVAAQPFPATNEKLNLLVIGGSQGAKIFSEVLPKALMLLPESIRHLFHVNHQCRPEDYASLEEQYRTLGMTANVATFFHDMPSQVAQAHLILSRAGASSLAEFMSVGRPAILVPYPFATDNHQYYNAEHYQKGGGGWLQLQDQFSPEWLAEQLAKIAQNPSLLQPMAKAAKQLALSSPAQKMTQLIDALFEAK